MISVLVIRFENLLYFGIYAAAVTAVAVFMNFRQKDFFGSLFLLGFFGTFAGVSSLAVKLFLVIAAAALFYARARSSKGKVWDVFILASGFLIFTLIWSLNFFFTPNLPVVLILTFILGLALFWDAFYAAGRAGTESLVLAMLCSLILTEVAWALQFLPVHYLTSAAVMFAVFYGIFMTSVLKWQGILSRKKVYFQSSIVVFILLVSLLSSAWRPL